MLRFTLRRTLGILVTVCSSLFLPAQLTGQMNPGAGLAPNMPGFLGVGGRVVTLKGDPVLGAMVQIENQFGGPYRVLDTDRKGAFHVDYILANREFKEFTVTLTVTKKGFLRAHRMMSSAGTGGNLSALVTLCPLQEDPALLPRADLIKGVAPRLRQLEPSDGLSAKETKDYARSVQDFLDRNRVDLAVPLLAKVAKLDPACLRCRTMLSLAELSWGDWDDFILHSGEALNAMIADKRLGRAEPLLVYGALVSWQHEPLKSSVYFTEAVKYSPQDALALQELGRAQCLDLDWEDAQETLKKALAAGAGPQARLLRAQALLWAGTADDAQAELDRYLNGPDAKGMPAAVRTLYDSIQEKRKDAGLYAAAAAKLKARGVVPLDYLHHPPADLPDFEPAADPSQLGSILRAVGEKIAELYRNLPDTVSIEKLEQARVNHAGEPDVVLRQKFHYLCLIAAQPWGPVIDEYRGDSKGNLAVPSGLKQDLMLTSGFVAAPLLLHPAYQDGSTFRYLGRQKTKGSTTYVVAFAQNPARARMYGSFKSSKSYKLIYLQGLAWIDDTTHQVVRLKTDLLAPLPQIKLNQETTEINFREVGFDGSAQKFWLPCDVTVSIAWAGRHLRNRHQYSDFMVFNVEQKNIIGVPTKVSQSSPPSLQP